MAVQLAQTEESFSLAVLDPEIKEVLRNNLTDIKFQFERIKIPAGGGLSFEITDENGEAKAVPEITGVIVDRYPVNAFWPDKFSGQKNPPACVALDGRTGIGQPGGDCVRCPYNQWGSDEAGRGKACKNLHRIYILPPGEVLPLLIALPPTSLANFNAYMLRLTSKVKKPYWAVITKIRLEKAANASGIAYSRTVFARTGDVPQDKLQALKAYIDQLRPIMRSVEVAVEEYGEPEEPGVNEPEAELF